MKNGKKIAIGVGVLVLLGAIVGFTVHESGKGVVTVQTGKVTAVDGADIELRAETICVHGDNPKALALVQRIRETLDGAGVAIRPPAAFL